MKTKKKINIYQILNNYSRIFLLRYWILNKNKRMDIFISDHRIKSLWTNKQMLFEVKMKRIQSISRWPVIRIIIETKLTIKLMTRNLITPKISWMSKRRPWLSSKWPKDSFRYRVRYNVCNSISWRVACTTSKDCSASTREKANWRSRSSPFKKAKKLPLYYLTTMRR